MKKISLMLAVLLMLCLAVPVGFASDAPEQMGPDCLHAYRVFDFDDLDTGEVFKLSWQSIGKAASAMTIPDGNGGTAVKYILAGNTAEAETKTVKSDLWCHGGQSAKGFICRVKTQSDPVAMSIRFYLDVDGVSNRVSHGNGESLKLYDLKTNKFIFAASDDSYASKMEIPANFDGYFIFEFRALYVDTGQPLRPNSSDPHIHYDKNVTDFSNPLNYTLFIDAVEGATFIMDDFGYMTAYADVPADDLLPPTDGPVTDAPATVEPTAEAPTTEAQGLGILQIVCISVSALSIAVIAVCILLMLSKSKKKKAEGTE